MSRSELAAYLAASGLAGVVATPVAACVENAHRMVGGDPDCTFGLSDWRSVDFDGVVSALEGCGVRLGDGELPFVDLEVAAAAIERQRAMMDEWSAGRARVLVATGHTFALLLHYRALAARLRAAGCVVLEPLVGDQLHTPDGEPCSIRYFEGVGTLVVHGNLTHTHRPEYMEAMLAAAGQVDGVIADHGFAGAAVEAGVPTLSIADVNDPALPVAQARGRTEGVLVIDDGLVPATYKPLTAALVDGCRI